MTSVAASQTLSIDAYEFISKSHVKSRASGEVCKARPPSSLQGQMLRCARNAVLFFECRMYRDLAACRQGEQWITYLAEGTVMERRAEI